MSLSRSDGELMGEGAVRLRPNQIALVCGAAALVLGSIVAWIAMWGAGGETSGLVRVPREEPLGSYVEARYDNWSFVDPATRYDGLYYYTIASDPLATGEQHLLIDAPAYRYGHAGHGWLARVVALGSTDGIPGALLLRGLTGFAVAAFALSRLATTFGLSPWWGLAAVFNPGLLYAVSVDTPETTGAALLGLGLLFWFHRHLWLAGALFIALCLVKEQFVFVPVGLGIYEIARVVRNERVDDLYYRLGILALGPLALGAWFAYLHGKLGLWPFAEGPPNITFPIAGYVDTLRLAGLQANGAEYQLGQATLPILLALGGLLVAGIIKGLKLKSPLDPIFVLSCALILCLSWWALLFPKDMWRNISSVLYLAPLVFFGRYLAGEAEEEGRSGSKLALGPDRSRVPLDDESG